MKNNNDLTPQQKEIWQRVMDNFEKLTKALFAKGPIVYQSPRCPTKDHYILEYEDESLYLALYDPETKEYKHVRRLKRPKRK